ncbi:MAG TPA: PEP-CTERM sorting domain-containing protein [Verrucomicrobiae bacterium]|nr:PEP-CTERM sorting domain-containing protein [Verrucomicrobiae bacterium]
MKKRGFFLASLLVLALCFNSNANITHVDYASDGDGVIQCNAWDWNGSAPDLTLPLISGDYTNCLTGGYDPGHVIFNVTADSADDPTLKISNSIDNDSTFPWSQVTVNLYMAVPFSVTNATLTAPASWSIVSGDNQNATLVGPQYKATLVYDTGPDIPNDGLSSIDFGYWVKFTGSPSYVLTQEIIPVPEPSTLALLVCGLLMSGFVIHRRRDHSANS